MELTIAVSLIVIVALGLLGVVGYLIDASSDTESD